MMNKNWSRYLKELSRVRYCKREEAVTSRAPLNSEVCV